MKNAIFILVVLIALSCKRNHSGVLVNVFDKDTGAPLANAKVEVIRKGKETWFISKKHLVVGEGYTDASGQLLVNFKYDRGNQYAYTVYPANGYFQTIYDQYFDLEKGQNTETVYMDQASYLKINVKSADPTDKYIWDVEIEGASNGYISSPPFRNYTTPIDTTIFETVRVGRGTKNIVWRVDSAGTQKNYSVPVELKGHDTTYVTLNF